MQLACRTELEKQLQESANARKEVEADLEKTRARLTVSLKEAEALKGQNARTTESLEEVKARLEKAHEAVAAKEEELASAQ
eukprot:scaffold648334_cov55-Prasinocladus_malaysianus.AAC.1